MRIECLLDCEMQKEIFEGSALRSCYGKWSHMLIITPLTTRQS